MGIDHIIKNVNPLKWVPTIHKILCKYGIHHSPMLKPLLVVKKTVDKSNKGRYI